MWSRQNLKPHLLIKPEARAQIAHVYSKYCKQHYDGHLYNCLCIYDFIFVCFIETSSKICNKSLTPKKKHWRHWSAFYIWGEDCCLLLVQFSQVALRKINSLMPHEIYCLSPGHSVTHHSQVHSDAHQGQADCRNMHRPPVCTILISPSCTVFSKAD